MCGRYVLSQPGEVLNETLESLEGYELVEEPPTLEPRFNVAPTQTMPIVVCATATKTNAESRELRKAKVDIARWEFRRAKGRIQKAAGGTLINARSETIEEKLSFRHSFHHQRCLVPASGFYEWRPKGNRQPFYFELASSKRERAGFCFAGLWQEPATDSRINVSLPGFCIVTGKAGTSMAEVHHRRPIILEPSHYADWLDPDQSTERLFELLRADDPELDRYPVSFAVNKVANDTASLLESVREAPTNLSLF